MIEKITLDLLTQDNVSVKKQQYIVHDGMEFEAGHPWRRAYINSAQGRIQVTNEVPSPYKEVIFLMWGDGPTIEEVESY